MESDYYTPEEIKALGAPFDRAVVVISLEKKKASITLIVPEEGDLFRHPSTVFPLDPRETSVRMAAVSILESAIRNGLLKKEAGATVVNADF